MEQTKMKVKELCDLKDKLVCALSGQVSNGVQNVNTNEAGEVVDMIKDLAEAEEKLWKACYYKCIVKAMHEENEYMEHMPEDERRHYDNWRYSSGRFAPTGRGHRSGYTPTWDGSRMEPWMTENMGYSDGPSGSGQGGRSGSSSANQGGNSGYDSGSGRYGYTPSMRGMRYENYARARRGYHETKDAQSKTQMDASAKDYVIDMAESVREMWKDADPTLRKEIKNHLVSLTSEMN